IPPPSLSEILIINISLLFSGGLKVHVPPSPLKVLVGDTITLPCQIEGISFIEHSQLSVAWILTTAQEQKYIFVYKKGKPETYREGAGLFPDRLRNGNVSLLLSKVHPNDQGVYSCIVFAFQSDATKNITLQVEAVPKLHLTPDVPNVISGQEKTLSCSVKDFYPKDVSILWLQKRNEEENELLPDSICTGNPVRGADDTYSISSHLRLHPTIQENGMQYICRVSHQTGVTMKNVGLTVTVTIEPPGMIPAVTAIISLLLITGAIATFIYMRFFKKCPPKMTDIFVSTKLVSGEVTQTFNREIVIMTCYVSDFRPKSITIRWYKNDTQNLLHSWSSGNASLDEDSLTSLLMQSNSCSHTVNIQNCEKFDTELNPRCMVRFKRCTSNGEETSKIKTVLIMQHSLELDNAAFICEVQHSALKTPMRKKILITVNSIFKTIGITCEPSCVVVGCSFTLSCKVTGFYPHDLQIFWQKNENYLNTDIKSDPIQGPDGLYSQESKVKLTATPDDQGAEYICFVSHASLHHLLEKRYTLNLQGMPRLSGVVAIPEFPALGESCSLLCKVEDFYPKLVRVTWLRNGEVVKEGVSVPEPTFGPNGLFYLWSRCILTATSIDHGAEYTCVVEHETICSPIKASVILHIKGFPVLSEIEVFPPDPRPNQQTTLSCNISQFYPERLDITWFRNDMVVQNIGQKAIININSQDKNGFCFATSKLLFAPQVEDHGIKWTVSVTNNHLISKVTLELNRKDFPIVAEIVCDLPKPVPGQLITLSCVVTGCEDKEKVAVDWFQSGKKVVQETSSLIVSAESCKAELKLRPVVKDQGSQFSCQVSYKAPDTRITKLYQLSFAVKPPVVFRIVSTPSVPIQGKPQMFQCNLCSFYPETIHISWFRKGQLVHTGVTTDIPVIGEDGLYQTNSKLQLTP
uniref:Ig-like domain-containing protein n=1 Tax=Latimeria chalumnae TaxID=7897 RepID=H3B9T8_LATCH